MLQILKHQEFNSMNRSNFKSSHVFSDNSCDDACDDTKQHLSDNFDWGPDTEESDVSQPEHNTVSHMIECIESICNYFIKNISVEAFRYDCEDVLNVTLDIPVSAHVLLQKRFNDKWSEYSRNQVFQSIQILFESYWNEESCMDLGLKLDDIVSPPKHKKHRVCAVKLWDGLGGSEQSIWVEASVVYVEDDAC